MGKDIIICVLIWIWIRYLMMVDIIDYYNTFYLYIEQNGLYISGIATVASIGMLLATFILRSVHLYVLMGLVNKLLFEVGQLAVCALSVGAVIFWFDFDINLWYDLRTVAIIPFEAVAVACLGLQMFDFNYPLANNLVNNILLPALTGLGLFIYSFF